MILRKAISTDVEIIVHFQLAMAMETEGINLDSEIVRKGVNAVFKDPTKGNYYVAEENKQVIASLLTTFEWSDWRNGTVFWIQSVFVEPKHRGKGIFKDMYKSIQHMILENHELKGIRLYADKTNLNAHKVYEKLGMNSNHYQLYEWLKD